MAKLSIKAGRTSETINVFIQDSSSTTGAGLTGLNFSSSGLTAVYAYRRSTSVGIALASLTGPGDGWSSGGFVEIDPTNMAGWYRLDLPNAVLAAGNGRFVDVHLHGALNMAPCPTEIELTGIDNQDAVSGGMSYLDASVSSRSTLTAAQVWDLATAGHTTAGTFGAVVTSAGPGSDPWATALPGSYAAGSAGYILGHNLDAAVSTRSVLTDTGVWASASRTLTASLDPTAAQIAAVILTTPAHLLATDTSGRVTLSPAGLDAVVVESGLNVRQLLVLLGAATLGVDTGSDATHFAFAGAGVSTPRVEGTTTAGKRSAVTLHPPA